jgi:hypothetical protein
MKRLMACLSVTALALMIALAPSGNAQTGKNITSSAQYEGIVTPAIDAGQTALFALTYGKPTAMLLGPTVVFWEICRLNSMSYLSALENEQIALSKGDKGGYTAAAITTNTVKDLRFGVEGIIESTKDTIKKLKADQKWYEDNINGRFANDDYRPTDADELRMWERHQAIKQVLKRFEFTALVRDPKNWNAPREKKLVVIEDAEKTFEKKAKECTDGLLEVLARMNKAQYALTAMTDDSAFLGTRMEALNMTAFGIEQMALALNEQGKTPRKQLRAVFTNQSKDMMFFVQVASRNESGQYVPRPYMIALYPDVSNETPEALNKLQMGGQPQGQRGPTRAFMGVGVKDKVIVRTATMGITRDRIRFMMLKGKTIKPDLNSLSRGYYYLGYESAGPSGTLVSRWMSEKETYNWTVRGGWSAGNTANDPVFKSSTAAEIRTSGLGSYLSSNFALTNDRMEWILPAGLASAADLGRSWAEVTGDATFTKVGPTTIGAGAKGGPVPETGSGKIQMLLELW